MRWLAFVALVACSSDAPEMPMDIIVGANLVRIYTKGADLAPCMCDVPLFPAAGECTHVTDVSGCAVPDDRLTCNTCFTDVSLEAAGVRLTPTYGVGDRLPGLYVDALPAQGVSLVLAGCGQPETRISLDGAPMPVPAVSATMVGDVPTVSWTTDIPAASAIASIAVISDAEYCHVAGATTHAFEPRSGAPGSAAVTAFAAPTTVMTAFGPATIWRGGSASTTFAMP